MSPRVCTIKHNRFVMYGFCDKPMCWYKSVKVTDNNQKAHIEFCQFSVHYKSIMLQYRPLVCPRHTSSLLVLCPGSGLQGLLCSTIGPRTCNIIHYGFVMCGFCDTPMCWYKPVKVTDNNQKGYYEFCQFSVHFKSIMFYSTGP
jgi:hypothetical protein